MNILNTFRFGECKNVHRLGDTSCPACRWDKPEICSKCEQGLVHIELSPKKTGSTLLFHCDICAGKGKDWNKT